MKNLQYFTENLVCLSERMIAGESFRFFVAALLRMTRPWGLTPKSAAGQVYSVSGGFVDLRVVDVVFGDVFQTEPVGVG